MKLKKLFRILLSAALVCGLLCSPALAASADEVRQALGNGFTIWIDTKESVITHDVPVRLSYCAFNDGGSITRNAEEAEYTISSLCQLPLGVTLTIGPDSYIDGISAYSDPDGDGIYEQRLCSYLPLDETLYTDFAVIPLDGPGFIPRDDKTYANYFEWYQGADWLENGPVDDFYAEGYRTLSTSYLTELFGANTILEFHFLHTGDEGLELYYSYWLLTGQERDESLGVDSIENYGLSVTPGGYLVSAWASGPVNNAHWAGLVPMSLEIYHNYDFTGNITRGEFAAVAVELYCAMSGTSAAAYTNSGVNPFTDVEDFDLNYPYILGAYELGIVKGRTETAFAPNDLVSRQDAALMLSRVFGLLGVEIPKAAATAFADDSQISSYARDAVAFMSANGIINGVGGNRFNPKGNSTVEQALKIALSMTEKTELWEK